MVLAVPSVPMTRASHLPASPWLDFMDYLDYLLVLSLDYTLILVFYQATMDYLISVTG